MQALSGASLQAEGLRRQDAREFAIFRTEEARKRGHHSNHDLTGAVSVLCPGGDEGGHHDCRETRHGDAETEVTRKAYYEGDPCSALLGFLGLLSFMGRSTFVPFLGIVLLFFGVAAYYGRCEYKATIRGIDFNCGP